MGSRLKFNHPALIIRTLCGADSHIDTKKASAMHSGGADAFAEPEAVAVTPGQQDTSRRRQKEKTASTNLHSKQKLPNSSPTRIAKSMEVATSSFMFTHMSIVIHSPRRCPCQYACSCPCPRTRVSSALWRYPQTSCIYIPECITFVFVPLSLPMAFPRRITLFLS